MWNQWFESWYTPKMSLFYSSPWLKTEFQVGNNFSLDFRRYCSIIFWLPRLLWGVPSYFCHWSSVLCFSGSLCMNILFCCSEILWCSGTALFYPSWWILSGCVWRWWGLLGSLLEKAAGVLLFSLFPSGRCCGHIPLGAGFGLKACTLLRWHQSVRCSHVWSGHRAHEPVAPRSKVQASLVWQRLLFSCSVMSDSLRPLGLQHARLPCPSPTLRARSNLCPLSQWRHPNISPSVIPFFSYHQSFPASGSFLMNRFFTSGGQCLEASASASVLPMNIQDWFPLGFRIEIQWSPCCPRDSQESSPTPQFKGINSLLLSLL